ncbi:MAG: CHASE4 domain-containing protein [Candidatus Micrarchaeia archaeon]
MKLRQKTFLITGLTLALFFMLAYSVIYGAQKSNVLLYEKQDVANQLTDAKNRIYNEGIQLGRTVGDWASWDDSYEFMHTRSAGYIESNLEDVSLASARIDFIGFYDENDAPFLVKAVGINGSAPPVPEELLTLHQHGEFVATPGGKTGEMQGFMLIGGKPAAIALRPILTSKGEGPARGTVAMVRYLTESVSEFGGARSTAAQLWAIGEDVPATLKNAESELLASASGMMEMPVNETVMSGQFLINDMRGTPVAVFRIETARSAYIAFSKGIYYTLLAFTITAVAFEALLFVLLDMFVLSRLRVLGWQVSEVGKPNSSNENITLDRGNDEISELNANIHLMLSRLKNVRRELLASQISYGRRLNKEVQVKTRMLTSANKKLKGMEKGKNLFLFNIGHELKSPLAVIEMNLEARKAGGMGRKDAAESEKMVHRNIVKLREKIEDIIQLSRFDYSRTVEKSEFDFAALVGEVAYTYHDFAKTRNVELRLDWSGKKLPVMGDRRLVQYAISNLFSNAVKHCGGRDVRARLSRTDGSAVLCVENEGDDIKPEDRKKLFRRFFKADQNGPGTGVGLFMTRKIAEEHAGRAWYEPRAPNGSKFYFSLPLKKTGGAEDGND